VYCLYIIQSIFLLLLFPYRLIHSDETELRTTKVRGKKYQSEISKTHMFLNEMTIEETLCVSKRN